jgi:hypothetical protein
MKTQNRDTIAFLALIGRRHIKVFDVERFNFLLICEREDLEHYKYHIISYKVIINYHMQQKVACSHHKLKDVPKCSFREHLLLQFPVAIFVLCNAQQEVCSPGPNGP